MYSSVFISTNPLHQQQTIPLDLLGEPASLLVVTNTHPPLSLVCQQLPHPLAFTPLPYIIDIDDINNLGRLRLGHVLSPFTA